MKTNKKNIICIILFCSFHLIGISQNIPNDAFIKKISKTHLPFYDKKKLEDKQLSYGFINNGNLKIPYATYDNLNLTRKSVEDENSATIIRNFNILNTNFNLITVEVGDSDWRTRYLVTLNKNGNVIDYIEAGVNFLIPEKVSVKQYCILTDSNSTDLFITVYLLNISSPLNCDPFNLTSVIGKIEYRTYTINVFGKFIVKSTSNTTNIKMKPYNKSTLIDKNINLWDLR